MFDYVKEREQEREQQRNYFVLDFFLDIIIVGHCVKPHFALLNNRIMQITI